MLRLKTALHKRRKPAGAVHTCEFGIRRDESWPMLSSVLSSTHLIPQPPPPPSVTLQLALFLLSMPRQSRSRSSASSAPRAAPAAAPSQSRGAHSAAAPYPGASQPSAAHAPPVPPQAQASGGPGLLAQMAATAGSVAVGSTIGHGLSSMLFGGSSHAAPAPEAQAVPVQQQQQSTYQAQGVTCETQAKDFTKCLEKADLQSCSWYLEQLKACQAAAAPY